MKNQTVTIYRASTEDYRAASNKFSLERPDPDHIYDIATVELPEGYTICDTVSGPCIFDDEDNPCELCVGPTDATIVAVSAGDQRYLHRVPHEGPPQKTLRQARLDIGLTQAQLADASGVNIRQIQRVELGESEASNLTARNYIAIVDALGIDPHDLL